MSGVSLVPQRNLKFGRKPPKHARGKMTTTDWLNHHLRSYFGIKS